MPSSPTRFGTQPIRLVLLQHGLTGKELATRIGVNYLHVNKVNRGITIPSQAYVDLACRELGVAPGDLFTQAALNASYYRGAK